MVALHTTRYGCAKCGRQLTVTAQHRQKTPHRHSYNFTATGLCYPTPVIAVGLQTLRNAAVGTRPGSTDPALILLAGVGASFNFNDYLHPASLCAAPHHCATARSPHPPISFIFRSENFSSVPYLSCHPFPEIACEATDMVWTSLVPAPLHE